MLDRLLARLHRRKRELLCVLDRPEIPLHTNGSENDIRAFVTKRKISGGTMSEAGRQARDGLLEGTVIVSDDAGQFRIGEHVLCWVHAERLVHKLVPATAHQRRAVEIIRGLIWWFYRDLKAF